MSNEQYQFWAIVDEDEAVVSVTHEKYGETKAVFESLELAQNCLDKCGLDGLFIRQVNVVSYRK